MYTIVECKGGTSELGGRRYTDPTNSSVKYVQQGTKEYVLSVIASMKNSSSQNLKDMAKELQDALDINPNSIKYFEVRQGFNS